MPISNVQTRVLSTIARNRDPGSYVAGATVLHRAKTSPRYSRDLDIFHDLAERVAQCATCDADTLRASGFDLTWQLQTPSFYRALVRAGDETLVMEWAQDSAFRFFPVEKDPLCGYRLHEIDAAINKVLALAGRSEVRDYVDTLHVHGTRLSLGALAWAACGKDPGFTPEFLLNECQCHVAYTQADIDQLELQVSLSVQKLKKQWLEAMEKALWLASSLPVSEIGCLYLDASNDAVTPDPNSKSFPSLKRHRGSVGGVWPTISAGPAS